MKTTVIHHSADFDGLFCREIARKFLPADTVFIGWDFGDPVLPVPSEGTIYVLDLPVDRVFGIEFRADTYHRFVERVIWIDHHATSIASHPTSIAGYRIDGVSACRLAWQWFAVQWKNTGMVGAVASDTAAVIFANKEAYVNREVTEPWSVRLAGEYDVWDKRDVCAEVFQFGLRSRELSEDDWKLMLCRREEDPFEHDQSPTVRDFLKDGGLLQRYQRDIDAGMVNHRSFMAHWEGLNFLVLNSARGNSLTFAAKDVPATGHDALMMLFWNGTCFKVSLYHATHRKDLDLSVIAQKYGGGGHRGACGFECGTFPWNL